MKTYRALKMARALAEEQLRGLDKAFKKAEEEMTGGRRTAQEKSSSRRSSTHRSARAKKSA